MREPIRGIRWPSFFLTLIACFVFWSTAAVEIFSVLFLLSSAFSIREIRQYIVPVSLWACFGLGVIASAFLGGSAETDSVHVSVFWHTLLFPAALLLRLSLKELGFLLRTFVISGAVAAASSLTVYVLSKPSYAEPVATSLTSYSILLGLAGGPCLYLLAVEKNARHRLLLVAAFAVIGFGVFFSARFVAILLFLLGTFLLVPFIGRKLIPAVVGCVVAALLLSPDATRYKLGYLLGGGVTDRYLLWQGGLGLFRELPFFGFGPGSFHEVLSEKVAAGFMFAPPSSWHNDYLAVFLESGWFSGVLFAGGVVLIIVLLIRALVKATADRRVVTVLMMSLSLSAAIAAATSSLISTAVLGAAWWIVQGSASGFLTVRRGNHTGTF